MFYEAEMRQKAREKERLYFNSERWNASWSGVKSVDFKSDVQTLSC